jgi:hypothetical protein
VSPWNDFDRGYLFNPNYNSYLTCVVEITSPKFWVLPLSKGQKDRYKVVSELRDEGLTYKEISNYLNTQTQYKPRRTEQFSPPQVFGIFDKMNKRIKRLEKIYEPKIYGFGLKIKNK